MSGKHYFNIITMRVAKAIIRYNVSKVLMTLSSFLIDRTLRAALFRESVKIKGDKGVEIPLGESETYCEGRIESVHSLLSSRLLYRTNPIL